MAGMRTTAAVRAVPGSRYAIVAAKFNAAIVRRLVQGAQDTLRSAGVPAENIEVLWVPGALELPLAARQAVADLRVSAVIAVGTVIQGDTDHYQHVAEGASRGLMEVSLVTGTPVTHGVLTVHTEQQARDRAGGSVGNKGAEAALAAVEMVRLLADLARRGVRAAGSNPPVSRPSRTARKGRR